MTNVAEQALAAERLDRAVKLKIRGAHWNEIAATCGYASPAAALRAVGEAMASATQRAEESADQMRDTAQMRYDMLLHRTLGMLDESAPYDVDGNQPDDRAVRLRAVDEARRLIEAGIKLNKLDAANEGSDEPLVVKIVGIDPADIV